MNLAESAFFSGGSLRDSGRRLPYWKRCMVVVGRGFWVRNFPSVRCCCGRRESSLPLSPGKFRSKRGRMDDPESEGTALFARRPSADLCVSRPRWGLFCPWVCLGDLGIFFRWSAGTWRLFCNLDYPGTWDYFALGLLGIWGCLTLSTWYLGGLFCF